MTAIELKKHLIHRIAEINDISFLKALRTILDSKIQHQCISLTPEQQAEIMKSKNNVEKGLFMEMAELDKEFEKWQKES